MITGSAMIVEPAITPPQSVPRAPSLNACSHTGSVWCSGRFMMTSAKMNSFHAWITREHRGGDEPGRDERERDLAERRQAAGAVDHRRFLELDRHAGDEAAQRPDRERQDEHEVRQRQPDHGVEQTPAVEHPEHRDHQRLGRDHLHDQHEGEEALAAAEPEAGEGHGGEEGDEERDDDRDRGHDQAVLDRRPEVVALEHLAVVVERAGERHERRMRRLDVDAAAERREHHPVHREDRAIAATSSPSPLSPARRDLGARMRHHESSS